MTDSRPYHWLVRVGFISRGITYGIIGGLAVALALGAGTAGTAPNQQGALNLIASTGIGRVATVIIAAGLFAYAVWNFDQGILGHGRHAGDSPSLKDRVANVAAGFGYLVFFAVAVEVLAGSGGNASSGPRQAAAGVLGWPGGPVLVAGGGLILIGVSAVQAYEACRLRFAQDSRTREMTPTQRHAFLRLGQVGLIARAAVFAIVGYFLIRTAIAFNAREAVGVDGALERLHHQDFGPLLTGLTGAGLITFAVFSVTEARYRRL